VLEGRVHRGDGETVSAVTWFCDLREFTRLSAELPPADLIDLLNEFFGLVAESSEAHGGEIPKFIGAPGRLDVTVVGPAVNVAARMQELARELDVPIVVSEDFRALCTRPLTALGGYSLRGVPGEAQLFTPAGSIAS